MTRSRDPAPDLFMPQDRDDTVEAPLAERMRPRVFADFVGQDDITAPDRPLRRAIEADQLVRIFWGPPGSEDNAGPSDCPPYEGAVYSVFGRDQRRA